MFGLVVGGASLAGFGVAKDSHLSQCASFTLPLRSRCDLSAVPANILATTLPHHDGPIRCFLF